MDSARAKRVFEELQGKRVGGWKVMEAIDYGKSALVLKAMRNGEIAALKVFDQELIERFGRDIQISRIEREKSLIGKKHPHLVQIKDGGFCELTKYCYLVMEYIPHRNIAKALPEIPEENIRRIISQVAGAAKFLEELDLVHRDIKPENILISDDFTHATLMDLGVIRPLIISNLTDQNEQKQFIGTLQYSPPELLFREEEHSLDGWRAVTFYQLGAVLHDLIMRKKIFEESKEPFGVLVLAVKDKRPDISSSINDNSLILLAQSCLVKNPQNRLRIVSWDRFFEVPTSKETIEGIKDRIKIMQTIRSENAAGNERPDGEEYVQCCKLKLHDISDSIEKVLRDTCIDDKQCFPPAIFSKNINIESFKTTITVCFRRSQSHQLNLSITLWIIVTLMDLDDEIVKINYAAKATKNCIQDLVIDSIDASLYYEGPFDMLGVEHLIKETLYKLIERGMKIQELYNMETVEDIGDGVVITVN
jgi:serine/threonine protein kinase